MDLEDRNDKVRQIVRDGVASEQLRDISKKQRHSLKS